MLVVIDPNNPTGAVYPPSVRRALLDLADEHDLTILADEVYGELGFDGPVPLLGALDPEAPVISFSSLSKAYLAPGWRTGWLVAGADAAPGRCAGGDEETRRRPSVQPGADAVRGLGRDQRRPLASGRRSARRWPSAGESRRRC